MKGYPEHPFYGYDILRDKQHAVIEEILLPFKGRKVDNELHQEIWDTLQHAKHQGKITIPFKVVMRRDQENKYPSYIEIILDTKV